MFLDTQLALSLSLSLSLCNSVTTVIVRNTPCCSVVHEVNTLLLTPTQIQIRISFSRVVMIHNPTPKTTHNQ
ncbi:hypothetical protein QBC46DRAFT_34282 [Diplogelasinospora grovesii]|uniref:Secreted protein n=1 Tax=Diplogelasinospora grovesii TaxID=303347 RepID=A0AAN6S7P4_9PEZI|nr:hypothetical protein QBC46DRAFT_34282 [Diplogelasinospora grovesii]